MKTVFTFLLMFGFALPTFALDRAGNFDLKSVHKKNILDLTKIAQIKKNKSSEDYRLNREAGIGSDELTIGVGVDGWSVGPTAFSDRRAIMTPDERRMEDQSIYDLMPQGSKGLTHTGSERRPTNFGLKIKKEIGARQ